MFKAQKCVTDLFSLEQLIRINSVEIGSYIDARFPNLITIVSQLASGTSYVVQGEIGELFCNSPPGGYRPGGYVHSSKVTSKRVTSRKPPGG